MRSRDRAEGPVLSQPTAQRAQLLPGQWPPARAARVAGVKQKNLLFFQIERAFSYPFPSLKTLCSLLRHLNPLYSCSLRHRAEFIMNTIAGIFTWKKTGNFQNGIKAL